MRQLIILMSISMMLLVSTGCQSANAPENHVEVIIDGGGQFPEFLVGRWKADRDGWEIVFESDGTISSAVHTFSRINLRPDQTIEVPLINNGKGVYTTGKWTVQYSLTGDLAVEIVLEHFRAQPGKDVLEGSSLDFFVGPVSEDDSEWRAVWSSYPKYKIFTDAFPDGKELSVGPDYHDRGILVFTKVE